MNVRVQTLRMLGYRTDLLEVGLQQLGCIPKDDWSLPREVYPLPNDEQSNGDEKEMEDEDSSCADEILKLRVCDQQPMFNLALTLLG